MYETRPKCYQWLSQDGGNTHSFCFLPYTFCDLPNFMLWAYKHVEMFSNVKGSKLRRNGRLLNPQRWIPLWVVDREIGAKTYVCNKVHRPFPPSLPFSFEARPSCSAGWCDYSNLSLFMLTFCPFRFFKLEVQLIYSIICYRCATRWFSQFLKLYSIYSFCKILAVFPTL